MNNTLNVSDSLVSRIQKLLRLASNNPNHHEAELALLKARQICQENEIELTSISIADNTKKIDEPIIKGDAIDLGNRMSVAQRWTSQIIQNHFKVKVIYSGNRSYGRNITFIGKKEDIQISTYINGFLNDEFMRLWYNYRANNSNVQTSYRESFLYGAYLGLSDKLTKIDEETNRNAFSKFESVNGLEHAQKVSNCMALAVVNHENKLVEALDEFYPKLGKAPKAKSNGHYSDDARSSGYSAGQNISLHMGISSNNSGGYIQ